MKVQWEESDIRVGRRVGEQKQFNRYMIGYTLNGGAEPEQWTLIRMSDGMIATMTTKEGLVVALNMLGYIPDDIYCS